jgi:hypothetical protein
MQKFQNPAQKAISRLKNGAEFSFMGKAAARLREGGMRLAIPVTPITLGKDLG